MEQWDGKNTKDINGQAGHDHETVNNTSIHPCTTNDSAISDYSEIADFLRSDWADLPVYEGFRIQKEYLCHLLDAVCHTLESYPEYGLYSEKLKDAREKLQSETFKVMVLGQFKMGKSTFINSLLGDEVLPADMLPCTAVINEVKWAKEKRAVLHFKTSLPDPLPETLPANIVNHIRQHENGPVPPLEVNIQEAERYVVISNTKASQKQSVSESIYSLMELYWPLELCRNNVEIIDSPGLNESPERTNTTVNYLKNADAVLFVMALPYAAGKSDMDFIDKYLIPLGQQYTLFVCNKIDMIPVMDREKLKANSIVRLKDHTKFGAEGVFFISSTDALDGKLDNNPELVQKSGINQLEQRLATYLTEQRGYMKLLPAVVELERSLDEIQRHIEIRQRELSANQEDIRIRYAEANQRLKQIDKDRETIFATIQQEKTRFFDEVFSLAESLFIDIEKEIPGWVETAETQNSITLFNGMPKDQIQPFVDELTGAIGEKIADRQRQWVQSILKSKLEEFSNRIRELSDTSLRKLIQELKDISLHTMDVDDQILNGGMAPVQAFTGVSMGASSSGGKLIGTQIGVGALGVTGVVLAASVVLSITASLPIVIPGAAIAYGLSKVFRSSSARELWEKIRDMKISFIENQIRNEYAKKYVEIFHDNRSQSAEQMTSALMREIDSIIQPYEKEISTEIRKVKTQVETILQDADLESGAVDNRKANLEATGRVLRTDSQKIELFVRNVHISIER